MEAVRQAYQFLRRHRRALGFIAGASAAALAVWRVKRVLDEYKRLIKEHDVARIDHHRCVLRAGWAGLSLSGFGLDWGMHVCAALSFDTPVWARPPPPPAL